MNIRMQTLELNILNLRLFNETVAERMDKFEEKIEILGNLVQNLSSSTMTNVFSLKENNQKELSIDKSNDEKNRRRIFELEAAVNDLDMKVNDLAEKVKIDL
jgi:hypothetical protein